jgi:hypothetical protein
MEGKAVSCRQLQLVSEHPETVLAVERALRKPNGRVLFDVLECIPLVVGQSWTTYDNTQRTVPKMLCVIDRAFILRTFAPLMRISGLQKVNLSPLCMSW